MFASAPNSTPIQDHEVPVATKEIAASSVTALSVSLAFLRALDTDSLYLFTPQELMLVKHFFQIGRQSFPFYNNKFNKFLMESIPRTPYSFQSWLFGKIVMPGYDHLILLRKLMIKNKIEEGIKNGLKQIVFVGGGYDIRAFIASLTYSEVQFYELDRGQTRDSKLKGLRTLPKDIFPDVIINFDQEECVTVNKNLKYISCDLSVDDLAEVLRNNGFDNDQQTLVICEGLTMYLDQTENEKLLTSISSLIKNDGQLILSYIAKLEYTALVSASLSQSKELYRFSLPTDQIPSFVFNNGLDPVGRYVPASELEKIEQFETANYFKTADFKMEEYYLLENKTEVSSVRTLESIPRIQFEIPPKPKMENTASRCTIL